MYSTAQYSTVENMIKQKKGRKTGDPPHLEVTNNLGELEVIRQRRNQDSWDKFAAEFGMEQSS